MQSRLVPPLTPDLPLLLGDLDGTSSTCVVSQTASQGDTIMALSLRNRRQVKFKVEDFKNLSSSLLTSSTGRIQSHVGRGHLQRRQQSQHRQRPRFLLRVAIQLTTKTKAWKDQGKFTLYFPALPACFNVWLTLFWKPLAFIPTTRPFLSSNTWGLFILFYFHFPFSVSLITFLGFVVFNLICWFSPWPNRGRSPRKKTKVW